MSDAFRELLKKVGSGNHTNKDLTRTEAFQAAEMMLLHQATPAQIGAFLISHRIKRPTGIELAGMLDAYDELGPKLQPINNSQKVIIFGTPYDGHSRFSPIIPITALILTAAGVPVILHGGDRMPTKEGIPLIEVWQGLGLYWNRYDIPQIQNILEKTHLGFVYIPHHFPLAQQIVPYRSQIGKRPPLSTLELIWCPYAGQSHIISGFVHPPTEQMFQDAHTLRGVTTYTTVKGLEGSPDLPRDRAVIVGHTNPHQKFERTILHSWDYGLGGKDFPLPETNPELITEIQATLQGKPSEMTKSAIWNGGFYLWHCGICPDLETGLAKAEQMIITQEVAEKLKQIKAACN
ncbi:MAG TPA: anthranilate phosphoribosyltransferase family protein [Halomicronema sp.]